MEEARQRGHTIQAEVLADMTNWMAEAGEGKTSLERPASAPRALNTKALYYSLALGTNPQPDPKIEAARALLLSTVRADQSEDGSWSAWPETRPPIFGGSDESATLLASLALEPASAAGDAPSRSAIEQAQKWLAQTPSDRDPQSVALRVILGKRLDLPVTEIDPLVTQIRERQRTDGGWSQASDMESDAWATGQALYALSVAGIDRTNPAIVRGREFLVKTQRENGSWAMPSRPTKPGGEGAKNLIPIIGAGSAWAVLGLVRTE